MDGVSMDSQFPLENEIVAKEFGLAKDSISFRDIVGLYSKFLRQGVNDRTEGPDGSWQEVIHQ
jgi:hypothetical protein